jgi:putative peptidoglycan lipid II flippase
LRLIDKTVGFAALVAVAGCAFGVIFRREAIALLFERGSFTAESTRMVAAVFLGFGPSLIGWSLIEITARSLFGMNRPWLPVIAGAIPVLVNVVVSRSLNGGPEWLGAGSSIGLAAGFLALFGILHAVRRSWSVSG